MSDVLSPPPGPTASAALTPFLFDGAEVRVVTIDGETWFVGKDVADRLGYADATNAIKQHCRGVVKYHPIPDALGRSQDTRVLSEPDVLRLIVGSTLPAADRFERWVFEDVLPAIRRTGSYAVAGARVASPSRFGLIGEAYHVFLSIAATLPINRNQQTLAAARGTRAVTGVDPLAIMGVKLIEEDGRQHLTVSDLGERMGLKPTAVNRLLQAAGLQVETRDAKNRLVWQRTAAGEPYSTILAVEKSGGGRASVQQLRWYADVIPILQRAREPAEPA